RDQDAGDGENDQREADFPADQRDTDRQLRQQPRLHELRDERLLPAPRPPKKPGEQRHGDQQQPKHLWIGESHLWVVGCRSWVGGGDTAVTDANKPPATSDRQFTAIFSILYGSK